jgi:Pentapeptide repeats (8 copies)
VKYDGKNLVEVLRDSQQYWQNSSEGSNADLSGAKLRSADLSGAKLRGADFVDANLSGANLSDANLRSANLRDANLCGASLRGATLGGANLRDADLSGADLGGADLGGADLGDANLRSANLRSANLRSANLRSANLRSANLRDADLSGADLGGADLGGADLSGANLCGAIGLAPITQISIDRLIEIAKNIVGDKSRLAMGVVHSYCGTAHCGAGWACINDPTASALEPIIGWCAAACFSIPIPEFTSLFYSSNQEMLNFLEKTLANNGQDLKDKYLITPEN